MNEDNQKIAIAEACGWEVINDTLCNVRPDRNGDPEIEPVAPLPDYLNDLNAMHEAEKVLDPKGKDGGYEYWLRTVCHIPERESAKGRYFYRATAAQRAEAFLRTIGKWEADK